MKGLVLADIRFTLSGGDGNQEAIGSHCIKVDVGSVLVVNS